jgi:hypothetical protein
VGSSGFLTTNYHVEVFRTAAFTVANTFTFVTIPWDTLEGGQTNLVNLTTGVFTVPIPGIWRIQAFIIFASGAGSSSLEVIKNAANYKRMSVGYNGVGNAGCNGVVKVRCNTGDTLAVQVAQNTTTNPAGLFTGSDLCWANLAYIGTLN